MFYVRRSYHKIRMQYICRVVRVEELGRIRKMVGNLIECIKDETNRIRYRKRSEKPGEIDVQTD